MEKLEKDVTTIVYVSPYRLIKRLEELKSLFGDIEVVVCRELTKIYEEVKRDRISDLLSYFGKKKIKGELTLCFKI